MNSIKVLSIVVILAVTTGVGFSKGSGPDRSGATKHRFADKRFDIYLLIGQSNMAGRAEIEPVDRDTLVGVWLFTGLTPDNWEAAANPLNKYSTVRKDLGMQKLGPGYTFAKTISKAFPDRSIGLVVNARGGTSIKEWAPGQKLYVEAIARARQAMQYGDIKGIVWHQGESDVERSTLYLEELTTLIGALRKDLGNMKLPFVAGELSEDVPQRKVINEILQKLPSKVKYTRVASSQGTTTIDKTHFNSSSQRKMGERMGQCMIEMIK